MRKTEGVDPPDIPVTEQELADYPGIDFTPQPSLNPLFSLIPIESEEDTLRSVGVLSFERGVQQERARQESLMRKLRCVGCNKPVATIGLTIRPFLARCEACLSKLDSEKSL